MNQQHQKTQRKSDMNDRKKNMRRTRSTVGMKDKRFMFDSKNKKIGERARNHISKNIADTKPK